MNITQALLTSDVVYQTDWRNDWVWGLPLIVLTVVFHVWGLGLINRLVDRIIADTTVHRHRISAFILVMGDATLLSSVLHACEATIWGGAYRLLGALPDDKTAMLYSLNAMTSYGHDDVTLERHWKLLGAIEALNGWLLFGLTTAFLFGMIVSVRSSLDNEKHGWPGLPWKLRLHLATRRESFIFVFCVLNGINSFFCIPEIGFQD